MGAPKRQTIQAPAAAARATGGKSRAASAAQQDLAEAGRRAKAARTPIARAATRQVLERKQRAYSGQAAREAGAQMRRGVYPAEIGTTPKRIARGSKNTKGRKA